MLIFELVYKELCTVFDFFSMNLCLLISTNHFLSFDDLFAQVYMLKYDSTHGPFDGTIEAKDGKLVVNGIAINIHFWLFFM